MGWRDRVAKADAAANRKDDYLEPGKWLLTVDALKEVDSQKGDELFIAEFVIGETDVEGFEAGGKVSYVWNFKHVSAPGNVKAFLCVLAGVDPDEISEGDMVELANLAVSTDNPFNGYTLQAKAYNKKTKAGGDFTAVAWELVSE